ncbi:MAG TPA: metallophosphoesterase [Bacilli bacterium]|nr:metallophosphoesterase [Bacilli bacterium]
MRLRFKILIGFLILLVIGGITYIYAMYIGAKILKVKEYKLESPTIVSEYNGLKIIHISDIHYGISINKKDLEKIVKDINSKKPDLVFLTGDLVDGKITAEQHKEITKVLSKIEASIGKYAVIGNHDHFYKKWNELISESGFTNLNDTYDIVYKDSYKSIFIAGISDSIYATKKIKDRSKVIFDYLNGNEIDNSIYKILLVHEPDDVDDIDYGKFDVILSGHSHNGQVRLPFIGALYTPIGCKKYYKEYYKLNDTDLYISSGLGTTVLPIRLFNRPSYNLYRLIANKK